MNSTKVQALVIVFALLFITSIIAVGCRQKEVNGWVNTSSLPGNTFSKYLKDDSAKKSAPRIVYLGSETSSNQDFGPRDISFEFQALK